MKSDECDVPTISRLLACPVSIQKIQGDLAVRRIYRKARSKRCPAALVGVSRASLDIDYFRGNILSIQGELKAYSIQYYNIHIGTENTRTSEQTKMETIWGKSIFGFWRCLQRIGWEIFP